MSEVDISKYFIIHKDKNNNIFAIEQINPKGLFEEITKQNEQFNRYKQVVKEIKEIASENKNTIRYSGICRSILKIIQKCEEVDKKG